MAMVDDFDVHAYHALSSTSSYVAPPFSVRPLNLVSRCSFDMVYDADCL